MNVGIGSPRQIEMHDMLDMGNVQTSGGDIGSDQDPALRRFEPVQVLQTLFLLQLRMQRVDRDLEYLE